MSALVVSTLDLDFFHPRLYQMLQRGHALERAAIGMFVIRLEQAEMALLRRATTSFFTSPKPS